MDIQEKRQLLKVARMGVLYGMGASRLSQRMTSPSQRVTRKNAEKLVEGWKVRFPTLSRK